MSGLKKTFCIPSNTPFRVQDLLTILNIKRTPRNVTGELQPLYWKTWNSQKYQVFSNFKKRVLNPAYKELKEKGDYYFEYELIKTGKKVISLNFQILKNGEGEKIRKDFHRKKETF